jgi:hypothetical protein
VRRSTSTKTRSRQARNCGKRWSAASGPRGSQGGASSGRTSQRKGPSRRFTSTPPPHPTIMVPGRLWLHQPPAPRRRARAVGPPRRGARRRADLLAAVEGEEAVRVCCSPPYSFAEAGNVSADGAGERRGHRASGGPPARHLGRAVGQPSRRGLKPGRFNAQLSRFACTHPIHAFTAPVGSWGDVAARRAFPNHDGAGRLNLSAIVDLCTV